MSHDKNSELVAEGRLTNQLQAALTRFSAGDEGRSVALKCFSPLTLSFSVRGEILRPAASVMKVPLVMSIYDRFHLGLLDSGVTVDVSDLPTTRYVSILAAFDPNRRLSVREACRLSLITSDNPLAVFLQSLTTFDAVNELLGSLSAARGCTMSAGFSDADLGPQNRKNLLSAEACIALLEQVAECPNYLDIRIALLNNLRNNRIPALLPDSAAVAHKTGTLAGVVNDAGIVSDGNVRFAVAFLTDNQPDATATSNDIATCSLELLEALHGFNKDGS